VRFGRPHVRGISCEAIADVLIAGESAEAVAEHSGLTRADVLVAAWFLGLHGGWRYRRIWRRWADSASLAMVRGEYDTVTDPPIEEQP
jgi:hypothetical protein